MTVIAGAAALVIVLALVEIPIGRKIRRWRRRREMRTTLDRTPAPLD
jgi:hypothetical protein